MLKAVLDTNVIISGLISHGGAPYQALEAWRRGDFLLFTSAALLDEPLDVLARPAVHCRVVAPRHGGIGHDGQRCESGSASP